MAAVKEFLEGSNGTTLAVIVASFVVLLTLVLLFFRGHRHKGRSILLVGLTDSGKTLLFSRLTSGISVMTHTSMVENKGVYNLKDKKAGKAVEIIDLPGHERLRERFLEQYKDQARGIIFIIDSANFLRELRDVANFMYDVLSTKQFFTYKTPILVACNKQDLPIAKSEGVIKTQLQKEINTLRVTRAAALQGLDGSTHHGFIGEKGKDFEFAHLHPIKVDFVESNVKGNVNGTAEISNIEKWINTLI